MMNNKMQRVINAGLDHYQFTMQDYNAVYRKLNTPPQRVRKKAPVLVLALIFTLALAITGVAATIMARQARESVVEKEHESAFLLTWQEEDRQAYVELMRENGIEFSQGDAITQSDEWLVPQNAFFQSMEAAYGPHHLWTPDVRFEIYETAVEFGFEATNVYAIPPEGVMQMDEAVSLAKQKMLDALFFTEQELDALCITATFTIDLNWNILVHNQDYTDIFAECVINLSQSTINLLKHIRTNINTEALGQVGSLIDAIVPSLSQERAAIPIYKSYTFDSGLTPEQAAEIINSFTPSTRSYFEGTVVANYRRQNPDQPFGEDDAYDYALAVLKQLFPADPAFFDDFLFIGAHKYETNKWSVSLREKEIDSFGTRDYTIRFDQETLIVDRVLTPNNSGNG